MDKQMMLQDPRVYIALCGRGLKIIGKEILTLGWIFSACASKHNQVKYSYSLLFCIFSATSLIYVHKS